MSIYGLQQMMRGEALKVMSSQQFVSLGTIMGYDPTNYVATVQLYQADPGGIPALQTGWLPVFTPWMGNGWGMFAPPNIGDIVEVHFQEGSLQNGYIALRSYNTGSPPLAVQSGEFWLVHASGSSVKLTNDGKLSINGNVEIDLTAPTVVITTTGNATINATGNATVTAASIKLDATDVEMGHLASALTPIMTSVAQTVYNGHTHNISGGVTLVPNQLMGPSVLTTNVKAN